ncbi:hypothetical protein EW146_g10230 [Bondarzewia mesenterica]|uniref:DUF7770 domain-containing protein n=1 Tax=Bondarzewia mesenterica TaxID=1095465 RepID=A0A4S4KZ80_9AGAM|nr:hypothetical protein EW146_g10230 [Bondarzewia mesenterica]
MTEQLKPIDTSRWQQKDQDAKVEYITVSAIKMRTNEVKPDDPTRRLVHWRAGAAYTEGLAGRSTSFDTRKWSKTDPIVEIQLISKDFYYSSAAVATCIWEVAKSFTATDVHNLIIEHHYDRYKYDGNASGCLFWTKAIIKMLE